MRRPYYNYWSYNYGDNVPEEVDTSVASYVPSKYMTTLVVPNGDSMTNPTGETPRKRYCNGSIKYVFLALFILALLAFVSTLIAWGVLSKGFKHVTAPDHSNGDHPQHSPTTEDRFCETHDCQDLADNIVKYLDPTADPCQSFYQYVCGRHSQENHVPSTNEKFGIHEVLVKKLHKQLKKLLEAPVQLMDTNSAAMAKEFFSKCMDLAAINSTGFTPLKSLIAQYGGWPLLDDNWRETNYSWEKQNAQLLRYLGVQVLLSVTVDPDSLNNTKMIITIDQPGISDKTAFAVNSRRMKRDSVRYGYLDSLTNLAVMFGADRTKINKQMHELLLFEALMLNLTVPDENRQNHFDDYHLMSMEGLISELPGIKWKEWFKILIPPELSISNEDKVFNVMGLPFLEGLADLLVSTSQKTLANYHMLNLVEVYVDYLSPKYRHYRNKLKNSKHHVSYEDVERWEECVEETVEFLPWPVSAMYIKTSVDPTLKDEVELIVNNMQRSMYKKLRQNDWMDMETKEKALDKLSEMNHQIAYPHGLIYNDTWIMEDFGDINIQHDTYFDAVIRLTAQETNVSFQRFSKPLNLNEWPKDSPPISVNAFYRFQSNEIVLPVGLLQAPLMSLTYPRYIQFSRIGLLAGHEISHGYDIEGSQYDTDGNLKMWWSNDTFERFQSKMDCFIKQYDNITEPVTGKQLQGRRMIGESVSDNCAMILTYAAYKIWLKENSVHEEKRFRAFPQFSPIQLFFISFANMWCETVRPEAVAALLETEEHALSSYRVDVPLQNFQEFSNIFQCQPGSPMNPSNKCQLF